MALPRRTLRLQRVTILEEPRVGRANALHQLNPRHPAERRETCRVQELPRRAVGLRCVEPQGAAKRDHVRNHRSELRDRLIASPADVNHLLVLIRLHEEHASIREIINVQELAPWLSCTPYLDLLRPVDLRFM